MAAPHINNGGHPRVGPRQSVRLPDDVVDAIEHLANIEHMQRARAHRWMLNLGQLWLMDGGDIVHPLPGDGAGKVVNVHIGVTSSDLIEVLAEEHRWSRVVAHRQLLRSGMRWIEGIGDDDRPSEVTAQDPVFKQFRAIAQAFATSQS